MSLGNVSKIPVKSVYQNLFNFLDLRVDSQSTPVIV